MRKQKGATEIRRALEKTEGRWKKTEGRSTLLICPGENTVFIIDGYYRNSNLMLNK